MPISRIWKEYWMQLSSSTRTTLAVWSWPTWFVLHFISFTGSWNIYWCAFQKLLHFHVQCNPFVYYFLNDCCFFFHFDWTVAVNFCHNMPIQEKPEVAWKRGLRALWPLRRLAVKTNGCRKKFQDLASKYWSGQIDTRKKNGSLKICRLKVNQVKF